MSSAIGPLGLLPPPHIAASGTLLFLARISQAPFLPPAGQDSGILCRISHLSTLFIFRPNYRGPLRVRWRLSLLLQWPPLGPLGLRLWVCELFDVESPVQIAQEMSGCARGVRCRKKIAVTNNVSGGITTRMFFALAFRRGPFPYRARLRAQKIDVLCAIA